MEADVWALGMTILESITGTAPYDNLARDVAVVLRIVSRGLPLRPNKYIPPDNVIGDQIWSLLLSCWASEPSERPTATYVRDCLKDIVTHATPTLNI
ncbi:hypothetical protein FRC07_010726 [Ceratobasidium sp. 392]|nr:hypothetical protein FRC07_010726 [Ceratobasidium sp. 392]